MIVSGSKSRGRHAKVDDRQFASSANIEIDDRLKDSWPAEKGFRKLVRNLTGIKVPPGKDELQDRKAERRRIKKEYMELRNEAHLVARIRRDKVRTRIAPDIDTCGFFSVVSEKGGVGKTTVSSLIAFILDKERSSDSIAIVDLNPDRGSLSDRMSVPGSIHSIRDMINHYDSIRSGEMVVRQFMSRSPGTDIFVLPGDTNPERRDLLSGNDVRKLFELFAYQFSIAVLDNGTGISHSAMEGNLSVSHGIVLVVENTNDAFPFVKSTLDRLEVLGYHDLRSRVILVINEKVYLPPELANDKLNSSFQVVTGRDISESFKGKVKNTIIIPFDPALARSGPIMMNALLPETVTEGKRLVAALVDNLIV